MSAKYADFIPGQPYAPARAYLEDPEFWAARRALFGNMCDAPHPPYDHVAAYMAKKTGRPIGNRASHLMAYARFRGNDRGVMVSTAEVSRWSSVSEASIASSPGRYTSRFQADWEVWEAQALQNGIDKRTFLSRMKIGWTAERAATQIVLRRSKR